MRRLTTIIAVLALLTALAGCGEDEPEFAPTPSKTSSTPTATPTQLSTTPPPDTRGRSDAAALAFAEFYVGLMSNASRTGNVNPLLAYSLSGCKSCVGVADRARKIHESGGSVSGEPWAVTGGQVAAGAVPLPARVLELAVSQPPTQVMESAGAKPKLYPGGKELMSLVLQPRDGGWAVKEVILAS